MVLQQRWLVSCEKSTFWILCFQQISCYAETPHQSVALREGELCERGSFTSLDLKDVFLPSVPILMAHSLGSQEISLLAFIGMAHA